MATTGIGSFTNARKRKPGDPVDDAALALNYGSLGPGGMAGGSTEELERQRQEAIFNASAPRAAANIAEFQRSSAGASQSFENGNVARGIGQSAKATLAAAVTPLAATRDVGNAIAENLGTSARAISGGIGDFYNATKGTASIAASQLSQGFSGAAPAPSTATSALSQAEIDAYAKSRGIASRPPAAAQPATPAASPAARPSIAGSTGIPNQPEPYAPFQRSPDDNEALPTGGPSSTVTPQQAAQMAKAAPTITTPTVGTAPEQRPTVRGIASFVQPPSGMPNTDYSSNPNIRAIPSGGKLDDRLGPTEQQKNLATTGTPYGIGTFSVIGGNEPTAAARQPQFKELNSNTMTISEYNDAKAFNRNLATSLGLQNQAAQTSIAGRSADTRARIDMFEADLRAQGMPSQIAAREADAEAARANASRLSAQAPLSQRQSQLELAVLNGDAGAEQTLKRLAEAKVGSKDFDLSRRTAFDRVYQDAAKQASAQFQPIPTRQMFANSLSEADRAAYGQQKVDYPKAPASTVSDLQARFKAAKESKNTALQTELLRRWSDTFGEDGTKYLSK
jgi:hypothetical protein